MTETTVIETERLYVRTWRESDIEPLFRIESALRLHTYTLEQPWTLEETRNFVEKHINSCSGCQPGFFNCPLILKATDTMIGRVGLNPLGYDFKVPELEFMIAPEHWGNDYATEIGRAMLRYGFEQAGFNEILGFALPKNIASRRVMEKIGMTFIGERTWRGQAWAFYRAISGKGPIYTADW